jgi:hypothetical protein
MIWLNVKACWMHEGSEKCIETCSNILMGRGSMGAPHVDERKMWKNFNVEVWALNGFRQGHVATFSDHGVKFSVSIKEVFSFVGLLDQFHSLYFLYFTICLPHLSVIKLWIAVIGSRCSWRSACVVYVQWPGYCIETNDTSIEFSLKSVLIFLCRHA